MSLASFLLAVAACSGAPDPVSAPIANVERPRLVVVISIDQYRADYLTRFADDYLPAKQGDAVGGFRFLTETGANYIDGHYMHSQTMTGPGHSVIMTGSVPGLNGIVSNAWYDRTIPDVSKRGVYCVIDRSVKTVVGTSDPMSPFNLKVTTVGDELKMATNGKAKVVGIALKDRASILMAGHSADSVVWFDTGTNNWVTSTHYAPNGQLPGWAKAINDSSKAEDIATKLWTPSLPDAAYWKARRPPFDQGPARTPLFSHNVNTDFFGNPSANDFVFETALSAIDAEKLGQDDVADVLVIGLSTNDYIGHKYGPNSPEVMDVSVRTDKSLSDFFNHLAMKVPGGLSRVVIALTADHGVVPIVEEVRDTYRVKSLVRDVEKSINVAAKAAMEDKYGPGAWIASGGTSMYLNHELLALKKIDLSEAQHVASVATGKVQGVYCSFTATDVMEGRLPHWPWIERVYNGFHPTLSPDVLTFENPGSYDGGGTGTGHGVPWAYDTHVPIVFWGGGMRAGTYTETVSVSDIAPTLSAILGIEQPSGCVGRPLSALGR